MDLFLFFLARTDIISILNITRNSPSHHRRFRWDEICFFFPCPPKCLELSSFSLRIMAANEFQIGAEMDFFCFFLARTDIISVLNITRNSPSHHRRLGCVSFGESKSGFCVSLLKSENGFWIHWIHTQDGFNGSNPNTDSWDSWSERFFDKGF